MNHGFLPILYKVTKISLGIAFILSGIRKLPGLKFTKLPIDNPVGLFFEGMYAAGYYWNFIGLYQIVVGVILCTPYWSRLSPILSMPVTVNIFLVSIGLSMSGTPFITGMMLLANSYLIFYHWKSYGEIVKLRT
jgi:uncharacterized membrane protein YphA (DoxX/SURF4 family)